MEKEANEKREKIGRKTTLGDRGPGWFNRQERQGGRGSARCASRDNL